MPWKGVFKWKDEAEYHWIFMLCIFALRSDQQERMCQKKKKLEKIKTQGKAELVISVWVPLKFPFTCSSPPELSQLHHEPQSDHCKAGVVILSIQNSYITYLKQEVWILRHWHLKTLLHWDLVFIYLQMWTFKACILNLSSYRLTLFSILPIIHQGSFLMGTVLTERKNKVSFPKAVKLTKNIALPWVVVMTEPHFHNFVDISSPITHWKLLS